MVTPAAVTLRDVARRADVHPSTASRALNAETRSLVNPDTVERVIGAAEELGYQPNSLARGLKTNRTFTVGVVIPDLTNPLFPPIVRGLEDELDQAGYTVVLGNTDNDAKRERAVLDAMGRRRVDALVLATARREYPVLEELRRAQIPVVLVNRTTDIPTVSSVTGDDAAGIGLAVRHLYELGHRRIAHVAGAQSLSTGFGRYAAYSSWMQSLGLTVDPDLVVFADWFREQAGAEAFRELLDRGVDFTAVVSSNDLVAMGCYDVAAERGLSIPEDFSLVGYNGMPFSEKFSPPLTTICVPLYQTGRRAAQLLLEAISSPDQTPVTTRLTPSLVVRGSTTAVREPTQV